MKLNHKEQCPNCLKKPLPYRSEDHFFCHKCCRQYSMLTGEQEVNWAWRLVSEDKWEPTYPDNGKHEYMNAKPTATALRLAQQS
jgi:hypothetical protein